MLYDKPLAFRSKSLQGVLQLSLFNKVFRNKVNNGHYLDCPAYDQTNFEVNKKYTFSDALFF